MFGPYWSGLDSPRHLTVFSKETLFRLMNASGFESTESPVNSSSYPLYVLSLKFALGELGSRLGDGVLRLMHKPLINRIGAAGTWLLLDRTQMASNMTVIGKKGSINAHL
jgi:hypothetical protein